jgi:hypothetical protein
MSGWGGHNQCAHKGARLAWAQTLEGAFCLPMLDPLNQVFDMQATVRMAILRSLDLLLASMGGPQAIQAAMGDIKALIDAKTVPTDAVLDVMFIKALSLRKGGEARMIGEVLVALCGGGHKSKKQPARGRRRKGAIDAADDEAATTPTVSKEELLAASERAAAFVNGETVHPESLWAQQKQHTTTHSTTAADGEGIAIIEHLAFSATRLKDCFDVIFTAEVLNPSSLDGECLRQVLTREGVICAPPTTEPSPRDLVTAAISKAITGRTGTEAMEACRTATEKATGEDRAWGTTFAIVKVSSRQSKAK